MYELPKDQLTNTELSILRRLRVWIVALGVTCLVAGIGIGALLAGRPTVAQSGAEISRAPEALSASFAEIAKRVEPAVVKIDTKTTAPEVAERGGDDDDEKDESSSNPLLDMFRRQSRRPSYGVGSGFIVDAKGYILTNQHVVQGATRITVGLQSGEELRGRVVGVDEETDVAVVKVDTPRDLPTVRLGDSAGVQVGDWVLAIGSPFGLDQTVTAGIISTLQRQTPYFTNFQQFLQTDAAINRGNSGGPLVNMRGEVIGINSQIATSTGDYNGIGFALPSNEASFVYQQIISQGRVRRGYLGIILDSVKPEFARVYGMTEARGVIVTDVREAQGPAGKAGIQTNDIIVEFNNQPLTNAQDLINKVAATPVGQTVPVAFLRDVGGKLERRTVNVTIGERPSSLAPRDPEAPSSPSPNSKTDAENNNPKLGITLAELTPQIVNERHLTGVRGLLVKDIDPNGVVADVRLSGGVPAIREGDIILRINRIPVASLADFQRVVGGLKTGDAIILNVARYDSQQERIVQRIVQFTYQ
ncbi:MAG TPA: Do family serine endopeptidase [Pyrinomonadaceae bacterium]|jgi:serine protease Do|nr:Do family serine endopeptidase [Pyrinomonadaceae bacterium]